MIMNTCQGHMTWYTFKTLVICYLSDHWALSNCCDPCWDSRHAPMIKTHVHPQIKLLILTLRVTQKHAFFAHQNNYSVHFIMCLSLSIKIHVPKRRIWAMLKTEREKRKISMPKGMKEKNACRRAWRKVKKKKRKK